MLRARSDREHRQRARAGDPGATGYGRVVHACAAVTSCAPASHRAEDDRMDLPVGVQREVIDVLATMAFATTTEVRA